MAKPSSSATPLFARSSPAIQIKDKSEEHLEETRQFLIQMSRSGKIPDDFSTKDFHSDLLRAHLPQPRLQRGRATCILSVKPAVCNFYGTIHGGFVAAAAEFLSIACARTVVAEDKDIFLGELAISYLSRAPLNVTKEVNFETWYFDAILLCKEWSGHITAQLDTESLTSWENAEVVIDASVVRSGRNLTIVAVEFKLQDTGKLVYIARSTFYNLPTAKL